VRDRCAVNVRAVYLGRPVLVAASLADLRGPTSGAVELPVHLYWSGVHGRLSPTRPADGGIHDRPCEACSLDDLAAFVNVGALAALWPDMLLPRAGAEGLGGRALRQDKDSTVLMGPDGLLVMANIRPDIILRFRASTGAMAARHDCGSAANGSLPQVPAPTGPSLKLARLRLSVVVRAERSRDAALEV
jgi:hypothetical protein